MVKELTIVLIAAFGTILFGGWILMLLLGMFAGYLAAPGLAIGYWATVGIFLMWRLAVIKVSRTND